MFQFTASASVLLQMTLRPGCPIRISSDHSLFATPRSFSQLITSFVASYSLGILHAPFSFLLFLNLLDCLSLSNLVFNGSFHHVNVRFESVRLNVEYNAYRLKRLSLQIYLKGLQKGGVPAAPSGTATLLRLSPSHLFHP